MRELEFAWDPAKSERNRKKHGVSFEEAVTVFYDDDALEYFDPDHSEDEDRFILLGLSVKTRVLVVCHCLREKSSVIRLISARKATRKESKVYWERKP